MNSVSIHALLMVLVMAVVTHLLRAFPFIVFGLTGKAPRIVIYLGRALSPAAIAVLVVYCFRQMDFSCAMNTVPDVVAGAAVVALHLWKRNPLLSIISGTVVYMLLIRLI